MKVVNDHIIGHFELQAHIGVSLVEDAATIERLTGEQAWLLDSLEDNREMAISGGAGSGKSVLAIEKAVRDARAGRRSLLTCFNAPLAKYLQSVCEGEENLEVRSFHSLCRMTADAGGMGSIYRSQHELVFALKHGTAAHINNFGLGDKGRHRSNLWTYAGANTFRAGRMDDLKVHPTVKPVEMVADAIMDCSQ